MAYFFSAFFLFILTVLACVVDFNTFTLHWFNLLYFIDIPSLLIVLPPAVFFGIAATSTDAFKLSFKITFTKTRNITEREAKEVSRYLVVVGDSALLLGLFGTLIGAVIILQNLDDPSALGPATAIMIITAFYGLLFKILCYVADQKVINKYLND